MDRLLSIFITSPAGQRAVNAGIRQGLQYLGGALMTYLALEGTPFASEWANLSVQIAAWATPLLVLWWTTRRAQTTEKTIETAALMPAGSTREQVDLRVTRAR